MDFFNSLSLDLKMLAVGIAGCVLLALFSGSRGAEKRYMVVLAVLTAVGVYRFMHIPGQDRDDRNAAPTNMVKVQDQHRPLVSTSAK